MEVLIIIPINLVDDFRIKNRSIKNKMITQEKSHHGNEKYRFLADVSLVFLSSFLKIFLYHVLRNWLPILIYHVFLRGKSCNHNLFCIPWYIIFFHTKAFNLLIYIYKVTELGVLLFSYFSTLSVLSR